MRAWIEKRSGKKGTSYRIRWEQGASEQSETFKTRAEAKSRLSKIISDDSPQATDKRSLQEYLEEWLATGLKRARATTKRRYADNIRLHINPTLGRTKLIKLTPLQIEKLYHDKLSTLSPASVAIIHQVLHKSLGQAVRWGILTRNASDQVEAPKAERTEFKVWSQEQTKRFLKASKASDLPALWHLAVFSGLRRGELLGLRWGDVDLQLGTISIRRTYSRDEKGNWAIGGPKTRSSTRFMAISKASVSLLKEHRAKQLELIEQLGSDYHDQGYVFTNGFGKPLHVNSFMLRYEKLIKEAGVPRIRPHDMRHTSASMSLANGTHPKVVQERLGHSSIAMTMDLYSHTTMQLGKDEADRLEELLGE